MSDRLRVLLIEDNPGDAYLIEELLPKDGPVVFAMDWVDRLSKALASVDAGRHDILLLDLGLPDSDGLETLRAMRSHAAELPLVVLTGNSDEQTGLAAVREGAQDYLIKGQITKNLLIRSINYAVARKQAENALKELNDTLEERIVGRTAQLTLSNKTLRNEIAERRRVEEALRKSEEQLRAINDELEQRVERRTRELQETQKQYLHAEKLSAIGKLSASIAHEFNNPLQGILSILKGLKRRAILEEEDRKLLDAAISEGDRIKNLIRSLQDFNRPSSGRKAVIDVHQSLDSMLLLHKSDFNGKRISVLLNYADDLPRILAVPDQLKQVILNLLTNAADACQQPGGTITVSTWQEEERVAIAIKDTGVGIEPEKMELIFQPFYTTKAEVKGTGLGLSVSYGIIKKHRGEIRVDSRPGEGATFTILLPIKGDGDTAFAPASF
jgi:signal transduction histidine kinase